MHAFNMHEAQTHLSCLVGGASDGEPVIIARAGKRVVKVVAVRAPGASSTRRFGPMAGQVAVGVGFGYHATTLRRAGPQFG